MDDVSAGTEWLQFPRGLESLMSTFPGQLGPCENQERDTWRKNGEPCAHDSEMLRQGWWPYEGMTL